MSHQQSSKPQSRGFASIIVTLVMMLVISLIVVGFAAVSRREQRQSLDQQLSTQAFYAAESGVEDARAVIRHDLATGLPANKANCAANTDPHGTYPTGNATVLDSDNQVSYSCLKVDVTPKDALYSGVGDNYVVVPIRTDAPIDSLNITWQPSSPPVGNPSACPAGNVNVFSPQPNWTCQYGVLRADVVSTGSNLTRVGLQSSQTTGFFVPSRTGGTGLVDYGAGKGQPNVVSANCDTANYTTCHATITNLGGGTNYVLRLSSLYRNSDISVVATQGGNPLSITGAQALIDSTGKAQDVLRRIQVRMPLTVGNDDSTPPYAIQTNGSICKRFKVSATSFTIPGDIVDPDGTNPMCLPLSSGTAGGPSQCVNGGNDMVLTADTTGSLDSRWNNDKAIFALQRSLKYFVDNVNIAPTKNHLSLISFSEPQTTKIWESMSSNPNKLDSDISKFAPDNSTQYHLALQYTLQELTRPAGTIRPESPKAVIFETDGQPDDYNSNAEKALINSYISQIKATGAKVYVIGINGQSYRDKVKGLNETILRSFAANGGTYSRADSEAQLQQILVSIANDLRCD